MSGELLLWQKFCAELAKELDCLSIDEGVLAAVKALKAQLAEANAGLNNLAKRLCLNHAATMCGDRYQRNDGKCEICEMQAKMAACECTNKELDRELRQERGMKALLANGMPPTGNDDFDKILATHPIAAMIQRGWLPGITGFDDLPALESAICHFWRVKTIAEAVDPPSLINPPRQGKP